MTHARAGLRCMVTIFLAALVHTGHADVPDNAQLQQQVRDTETAFAKTMTDRDHRAFVSFLADEAVFFSDGKVLRGRQQVADGWKALYEKPDAPSRVQLGANAGVPKPGEPVVEDKGEKLQAQKARLIDANNSHSLVELELTEGKNREVRRLFESQGLTVSRLQRTQIGPIKLGELPLGKWRALTEPEIKSLLPKI